MRTILVTACLWGTTSLGFAQLDSDTLTVTSSRTVTSVSDEVNVTVYVDANPNSTLDGILATLQPTGLAAANLVNVYPFGPYTEWTFRLIGPYSKLKDMLAPVLRFPTNSDLQVRYSVFPASVRPQSADACAWSALVSDAQAEAQRLAVAAGVRVGPILALSDTANVGGTPRVASYASFLLGTVTIYDPWTTPLTAAAYASPSVASNCTLTVQFKLLR